MKSLSKKIAQVHVLAALLCMGFTQAQSVSELKVLDCQGTYRTDTPIRLTVHNSSSSTVLVGVITLQGEAAGTWVDVMPFLGVHRITKAAKLERFLPGEKRQFIVNEKETQNEYRAHSGNFRIVFQPFDEEKKHLGDLRELVKFRVESDAKK